MTILLSSRLLRAALSLDAVATIATGAMLAFAPATLSAWFGLPRSFVFSLGVFQLAYATIVVAAALRTTLPNWIAWTLVFLNVVWVVDSVGLLLTGWISPTDLGVGYVLAQAAAVLALAVAQAKGIRQSAVLQPSIA